MSRGPRSPFRPTRREFLAATALGLALPPAFLRAAQASPESAAAAMKAVTGGAPLREGKVTLEIPPIAENGNSVPLTLAVDSPMTPAEHVRSIHLFAEENPLPNVARFTLGPRAGRAQVSTRIRLFKTQKILAIAALSDGSFWSASAEVVITLGACLED
ncbi:MAG TPA: SoxY-related AACIE arm protein [Candidatus Sulfotelmatobacter sp.]|nr:SoxY-related AACIE arm protein [Candidatus Sulfotelmatobacter sp.]